MGARVVGLEVRSDVGVCGRDANGVLDTSMQAIDVELPFLGKLLWFIVRGDKNTFDVVLLQPDIVDFNPVLLDDFDSWDLSELLGRITGC